MTPPVQDTTQRTQDSWVICSLAHTQQPQSETFAWRQLSHSPDENIPAPTWDKHGKGQSRPRTLVPAPEYVLRWVKLSSWYQSTFHISSGSFSTKEVTPGVSAASFLPFPATWLETHLTVMPLIILRAHNSWLYTFNQVCYCFDW